MKKKVGAYIAAGGGVMAAAAGLGVEATGYLIAVSILLFAAGLILLYFGLDIIAQQWEQEYYNIVDEADEYEFIDDNEYKDKQKEQENWNDTYKLARQLEYREILKEECKK